MINNKKSNNINMDQHGWVTIDFMIAFTIIILTIPSMIAIIGDRIDNANSIREITEARILVENIATIVEMVYSGGVGCSYIVKMPAKIGNKPYSIKINSSGVYVRFNNNIGTAFITPMRISEGRFHSNILLEPNKTYNISNIENINNYNEINIEKIYT
jgi:hypothetical protein